MYQYDDPTVVATLPTPAAPGTAGYFTDGNPGSGLPATLVRADFMNMMMLELLNVVTTAGLTPSKTDHTQLLAAIKNVATGRLLNIQTLTVSGTYTPTAGTTSIVVEMCGGGGGGGGTGATTASTCAAAGGGSYGNYRKHRMTSGFSGASVTIGAGGSAGAAGANNGGNGGTTSFGSLNAGGGVGGAGNAAFTPPLMGGSGGQNSGFVPSANIFDYAGQPGSNGMAFSAAVPQGGQGGSGALGAGGCSIGTQAPHAATGYGSGGAGSAASTSMAAQAGNAGAPGVVIVYEYA